VREQFSTTLLYCQYGSYCIYGYPDVVLTEFTNVEGLWRGGDRIFRDFLYTPAERPVVAQIFGCRPEYFYKAAHVVCELGFDGVDIKKDLPQYEAPTR
jgi:tRNA-dihydrouridine synthase